MLPDRVSNPGPLTYESDALSIALRGPASLDKSTTRTYCGRGGLDIFSLVYNFSFLSPSLWETVRYRLKYCLKGPLSPKQPTNPLTVFRSTSSRLPEKEKEKISTDERNFIQTTTTRTYYTHTSTCPTIIQTPCTESHPTPSQDPTNLSVALKTFKKGSAHNLRIGDQVLRFDVFWPKHLQEVRSTVYIHVQSM